MEKFLNYLKSMPLSLQKMAIKDTACVEERFFVTKFSDTDYNVYDLKKGFLVCSHIEDFDIYKDLSLKITVGKRSKVFALEGKKISVKPRQTIFLLESVYVIKDKASKLYDLSGHTIAKHVEYLWQLDEKHYAYCAEGKAYYCTNDHKVLIVSPWEPLFPAFPRAFPYGFIVDNRHIKNEIGVFIPFGRIYDLSGNIVDTGVSDIVFANNYYYYTKGEFLIVRNSLHKKVFQIDGVRKKDIMPNGAIKVFGWDGLYYYYGPDFTLYHKSEKSGNIHFYPNGSYKILKDGKVTVYSADKKPQFRNVDNFLKLRSWAYLIKNGKLWSYYDPAGNFCFSYTEDDPCYVFDSPNPHCFIAYYNGRYDLYRNDKRLIIADIEICENCEPLKGWYIFKASGKQYLLSPKGTVVVAGYDKVKKLPGKVCLGINNTPEYKVDLYTDDGLLLQENAEGITFARSGKFIILKDKNIEVVDYNNV